jgi:hypothetical protein
MLRPGRRRDREVDHGASPQVVGERWRGWGVEHGDARRQCGTDLRYGCRPGADDGLEVLDRPEREAGPEVADGKQVELELDRDTDPPAPRKAQSASRSVGSPSAVARSVPCPST